MSEKTATSTEARATPAADADADAVPDAADRCPDEPEDRDGFEDEDGCVDRDNDGDGVLDAYELKDGRWTNCDRKVQGGVEVDCRNQPEDRDGDGDDDGCPDVGCLSHCAKRLLGRVHVDRRGRMKAGGPKLLDEIAAAIRAEPELTVEVEGHFDWHDNSAAAERITTRFAEQMVDELVARGVSREHLQPSGHGASSTIDDSRTAAGRADNRRVDFYLLPNCCPPAPPIEARGCA